MANRPWFPTGYDLANTINALGTQYLQLKQYTQVRDAYQKTLQVVLQVTHIDKQPLGRLKARSYHGLGIVAQEQQAFQQAEQYYQQTLQIYEEYNDRYGQASTYHQLGRVAEEQWQWQQARDFFLHALEIVVAEGDD